MNETTSETGKTPAWWPWVLPFLLFMVFTAFEPKFGDATPEVAPQSLNETTALEFWNPARKYFLAYSAKILAVAILVAFFFRLYLRQFPIKISWLGVAVGLFGGVLWIALCHLQVERAIGGMIGLPDSWFARRSGINPAEHYASFMPLFTFFAVRFAGLVIIVPIIEEVFLRGFFVRYMEDIEWWNVKFHRLGWFPLMIAPIYGVLAHPMSEALAAAAWFGLVTWLMVKSRNLWDCVLAHAITNLMLGMYVVWFGQWQLW